MLQNSSPPMLTLPCQIVVLTTNLVLDEEALENGAARFFSETSLAAEGQVCAGGFLKVVFLSCMRYTVLERSFRDIVVPYR